MMTYSIPFHHAFIFRIFWIAKNSQQLSISIPPPYILWWSFSLPVQTHWMILIVVINNLIKTDMGYPKIAKVIVVENFPVLREYYMKECQVVILFAYGQLILSLSSCSISFYNKPAFLSSCFSIIFLGYCSNKTSIQCCISFSPPMDFSTFSVLASSVNAYLELSSLTI